MKEGWKVKTIGEVILPSGTIDPHKKPNELFRYVDVSSISNRTFEIVEISKILGKDAPSRARRLIKSGDILFATVRPTLRRIAVVPKKLDGEVCSTGYFVFRTKPELDGKFLYYHLFTDEFMSAMESLQSGASYPAVNDTQVKQQKISFPPLAEQKRIVAILDEAFAGIDRVVANTQKNLANAREMFESYLNGVFTRKGEGWVERRLGEVVSSVSTGPFGSMLHKSDYIEGGIPIINPINIIDNSIIPSDDKTVNDKTAKRLNNYILDTNDIVIARRGEIGRCAVVQPEQTGWICGTGCFYIKTSKSINSYFLSNLIRSAKYRKELEKIATGATMQNLSNTSLQNLVISYPSNIKEQLNLVLQLKEFVAEIKRLESIYQQKLTALAELKQSILQKAFAGELT